MQPTAEMEREFLVPLGALQEKFSRYPNIARVPNNIVREGSLQLEATPVEKQDSLEERSRILKFIQDTMTEGNLFEGKNM